MPRDWTESEPPEAASACRALDSCGGRERADEWRSQGVWLNLRGSDSPWQKAFNGDGAAAAGTQCERGCASQAGEALARRWRPQGRESATRRCEVRSLGEGKALP